MRLEDVQLAIRQRSILECLDLTFLFCSRHWLGLLITGALGIVPFELFDWWMNSAEGMNEFAGLLLAAMEIPWATMFVTLYLGQVTFSETLSLKRMFGDAGRALPGFLLFQLIVRGLCLMTVVLSPVVFLGMYYLNEIILLEKPALNRIWKRRTAMNARIMGRIISLWIIDCVVLFVGTFLLTQALRAVSAIWEDRLQTSWLMDDGETILETLLSFEDWQLFVAANVVIVFLAVFRFVTYLDSRIRREGWDVELKLRAQVELYRKREADV